MKKLLRLQALILCIIMLLPMFVLGYSETVIPNKDIDMPKSSPVIDGNIETDGNWSDPAYINDATLGRFWADNLPTTTAEVYFAYDDNGLYFAADIVDNHANNGFVPSTGLDNINNDGTSRPYGFNGDVMTLMLDPLGVFERSSYSTTPWYNVGIFADNTVKVYRSKANEGEITSDVTAKGAITDKGWKFEIYIPWNIIVSDVASASSSNLSVTKAVLATIGSKTRAACMYMDRYYMSPGVADTWGRFITVCQTTYDGINGPYTSGTVAKAYGLILNHGESNHVHDWSDWTVTLDATCTEEGSEYRTCLTDGYTETVAIPPKGHSSFYTETVDPTCTEEGINYVKCGVCSTLISTSQIPATGHTFGEWYVVTEPTELTHGLKRRICSVCNVQEDKLVPAFNAPALEVDNYLVYVYNASKINHIRYAKGIYTTSNEIRNAPDCVNLDSKVISNGTIDDIYTRNMINGGVYSFWIRMNDGSTYIMSADLSYMKQTVTSEGVIITVHNLYGVKDFFIAKGDYNTYREVADNMIVNVTPEKIGTKQNYSYTVSEPGRYTVCVRYNDTSRDNEFFKINLTVTEPVFEPDGLQLKVGNLTGVRVIRAAYGDYNKSGDIKRAVGCRNFTPSTIKGADPYTIQFKENGLVSVCVEYTNGYVKTYQFEVQKKVPTFMVNRTSVVIGNLDGLQVIRYAPGEYSTSSEIKNAPGSKYIRPSAAVDGIITVSDLTIGEKYSFSVQYTDQSYNYYTATVRNGPVIDPDDVISVSDQRQLMLEDYVIDFENSNVSLLYNTPVKKQVVFRFDKAYEARDTVYHNIVKAPDGNYRMYYKATDSSGKRRICYIQSTDGLNWTRPALSNNLFNGSLSNIVTNYGLNPDNLFVFYDTNPACPPNQRWKGIYGQWGDGLFLEYSADGNNFNFWPDERTLMTTPTATQGCFFDSLNTVYWDAAKGKYVAFVRGFHVGNNYNLTKEYVQANPLNITRDIRYSESVDFINWTVPVPLVYDDSNDYQMYTNAVVPYYRAPQLYIGMPTRYQWVGTLPVTDIFLMSSRDLKHWDRTPTPYLTPNSIPGATWDYGDSGYPCIGYIETAPGEISFYMKEIDKSLNYTVLYRYTLRTDGFRRAYGSSLGNTLVTKYMNFSGSSLELNYAAGSQGKVRVTMTDEYGNAIASDWLTGDQIAKNVTFNGNITDFKDRAVYLTFELYDASLYSFKFN